MMRKIIALAGLLAGVMSLTAIVWRGGMPFIYWLFGSFSVYLLLSGFLIYFKRTLLQTVIIPFLLFYGMGGFLTLPLDTEYIFGLAASGLMILMVFYILLSQLAKLRILRTVFALLLGMVLFMAVQYAGYTVIEDRTGLLLHLQETERTLFAW